MPVIGYQVVAMYRHVPEGAAIVDYVESTWRHRHNAVARCEMCNHTLREELGEFSLDSQWFEVHELRGRDDEEFYVNSLKEVA